MTVLVQPGCVHPTACLGPNGCAWCEETTHLRTILRVLRKSPERLEREATALCKAGLLPDPPCEDCLWMAAARIEKHG